MYISKKIRELIKNKYNGYCAYSGTLLESDWQIDHVKPVRRNSRRELTENHNLENLVPCQKIINHYKHTDNLETFRRLIKTLHLRIAKLPKNPVTEKSKKHKAYMLLVAKFFDITAEKSFNGIFYFEKLNF